jgi:hypothetical protein
MRNTADLECPQAIPYRDLSTYIQDNLRFDMTRFFPGVKDVRGASDSPIWTHRPGARRPRAVPGRAYAEGQSVSHL